PERQQYARLVHDKLLNKGRRIGDLRVPPGRYVIRFTVASDGTVSDIKLIDDTGSERANGQLLDFVLRAAPFPSPPDGQPVTFNLPLRYAPGIDPRPKDIMRPER